jgi:hypothetical protein
VTKTILLVLGVPRSGTSAIARGLKALGISLGEKFKAADDMWNPKGFWEDTDIVYKINRGVLYALDYSWMGLSLIQRKQFDEVDLQQLKKEAIDLIKERTACTDYFGFKDPRAAKILPFWQGVFKELKLTDKYIIALRNPLASACSYQRVSGEDIETGLLLWLMHLIPAIEETWEKKRIMVSYDLLLKAPELQLERMQALLDLPNDLCRPIDRSTYVKEFLDKNLQHYAVSMAELSSHPAISVAPFCLKMYELFLQAAKDELTLDSDIFKERWQTVMEEFNQFYPLYLYMDKLQKKNKCYEKNIRTIKKSAPWKLAYPLRMIDDFLRAKRRKARAEKRLVINDE